MARIELHSQPCPAELHMRDWFVPLRSTAGGRVPEHSQKEYSIYIEYTLHTYTLYYLAVDDGTRDQVEGWEVPIEAWNLFPLGTNAEALVAGDGRYPYYLAHL